MKLMANMLIKYGDNIMKALYHQVLMATYVLVINSSVIVIFQSISTFNESFLDRLRVFFYILGRVGTEKDALMF